MTTAATSLLGLALPVTGELSGTWGDTVNNSITALLDSAVAGTTTLSADADVTLTTTTLAANQAREAIILWTAAGTVTRYITAPAQSKIYAVLNKSSTQSIVLRGVGPTTGVTILAGKQAMVAWDGTDYVEISSGYVDGPATSTDNAVARFDGTDGKLLQNSVVIIADTTGNMTGVGTLSSGAITSSSLTATRVLFAGTSGLIQDDADLTFNGTILTSTGFAGPLNGTVGATTPAAGSFTTVTNSGGERFTAAGLEYARIQLNSSTAALELMAGSTTTAGISLASNVATFLNNPVLTGGTANGVAYLDGSKVLTSGTALTFNGTTFGVTGSITASGTLSGTGTNTWTLQSVGASGSLVAGGWLYGGNEGFNLSPNGSGLTKRLTISYFTGAAYSEALGISNVNTGPNTGILSLLNNVALVTSSGLEVTQSQLIGYSSYSGLGSYGLAVAGNVGIGTSSPAALLHLSSGNGTKAIWGTTRSFTVNRNWQVAVDEYAEGQFTITPSTTLGGTTFTTPAIRVDSAGNVGIGASSPAFKLDVGGSDGTNIALRSTGTAQARFRGYVNGAESGVIGFLNGGGQVFEVAGSEAMRLTSSGLEVKQSQLIGYSSYAGIGTNGLAVAGNVGIGTSSPTTNLEIRATNPTALFSNSATRYGYIQWENSGSELRVGTDGAFGIRFDTNATRRMTLDASGNLGLGVTPSASTSNYRTLQIGSTGVQYSLFGQRVGGNAETFVGWNAYGGSNTTGIGTGFYYTNSSDLASMYSQNGQHAWWIAPSGTAGAAISFTQAMTLDASGNLLVGTTSSSGAKLEVNGNIFSGAVGSTQRNITLATTGGSVVIVSHSTGDVSGDLYAAFTYNGSQIGSITQSGTTAVLYNTTSDYRLKTVIGAVADSGSRIDALQPVEYTWNAGGERTRGFLAHQFQEVYAGSVTGTKDAVDAKGKPVYQAMQAATSEVIADLVAEIQDLRKRLATLEAK